MTWPFVGLAAIQTRRGHWQPLREMASQPKKLGFASVTAAMLFMNWLVFTWAINHDRVTEAALGYFLLPLVSVLLNRVVFRELLRPVQIACLALVSVGVAWLTADVGKVPWVTIVLGFSFAIYGAIRKRVEFGALDGLTPEVAILLTTLPLVTFARAVRLVTAIHCGPIPIPKSKPPVLVWSVDLRRVLRGRSGNRLSDHLGWPCDLRHRIGF